MEDKEFKQRLALALASNTEFIKQAKDGYDGNMVWYSVSDQISCTVNAVTIKDGKQ